MEQSSFATKFLSRIQRVDRSQIEAFLAQLVKEKDFHRAILDSLPEGILVTDSEHRIVFINETGRGLLGLGRKKILGEQILRALKVKALQDLASSFLESGEMLDQEEVRLRTPQSRIYALSVSPIHDSNGELTHSVWILDDRTSVHRRAAERHQMESMRSLSTLVSGIAHEIKNPLNSLNIHAQLIGQAADELVGDCIDESYAQRLKRSTGVLLEEINRLTRIVDQFIRAARPAKLELIPTDINDLVESVAELIRPECEARNIELELDLERALTRVKLDPEQVRQALLNIARNAMEAIDKPEGRIEIRTTLQGDHALIEIQDNGCGIPEDQRLAIFEPYHTTKSMGTGLGLMVVFRIISAHRGALGLDSEFGQGTVFRIGLPLDERPVRLIDSENIVPPGQPPAPDSGSEKA
ncbi:PAS domain-containing protein [bacterium]|nr:PAS domain-containing protein [bacterium]